MERYPLLGLGFHLRLDSRLPSVVAHRQADLAALTADHALDWRAVILHCPYTAPIVCSTAGWVVWIIVQGTLLPRILEHLVTLGDGIGQRRVVLSLQSRSLHFMAVIQQSTVIALQFLCKMKRWDALYETAYNKHDLVTGVMRARPHRACEQVEHSSTGSTSVVHDWRPVAHVGTLPVGKRMPVWTAQAFRVERCEQKIVAFLLVKQFGNRKAYHGYFP
jgi:hypothetical protein